MICDPSGGCAQSGAGDNGRCPFVRCLRRSRAKTHHGKALAQYIHGIALEAPWMHRPAGAMHGRLGGEIFAMRPCRSARPSRREPAAGLREGVRKRKTFGAISPAQLDRLMLANRLPKCAVGWLRAASSRRYLRQPDMQAPLIRPDSSRPAHAGSRGPRRRSAVGTDEVVFEVLLAVSILLWPSLGSAAVEPGRLPGASSYLCGAYARGDRFHQHRHVAIRRIDGQDLLPLMTPRPSACATAVVQRSPAVRCRNQAQGETDTPALI